jgi:hypothetical protein
MAKASLAWTCTGERAKGTPQKLTAWQKGRVPGKDACTGRAAGYASDAHLSQRRHLSHRMGPGRACPRSQVPCHLAAPPSCSRRARTPLAQRAWKTPCVPSSSMTEAALVAGLFGAPASVGSPYLTAPPRVRILPASYMTALPFMASPPGRKPASRWPPPPSVVNQFIFLLGPA